MYGAPMASCSDLDEFFDRELDEQRADAFRDHLASCARCQTKLLGLMREAVVANVDVTDERTKR